MTESPTDSSRSLHPAFDDLTAARSMGRSRLPVAAAVTLLVTALSTTWLATHALVASESIRLAGGIAALVTPALLASWLALGVTRRRDLTSRDRRGWVCVGLAAGAAAVFALTTCVEPLPEAPELVPVVGAAAHALMLVLGTVGALHWVRRLSPSATVGTLLELACVAVLAYVVTWRTLMSAALVGAKNSGWTVDAATLYLTPLLATALLVAVVTVISQIGKQELRGAELLGVFGLGMIVASDLGMALRGSGKGGLDDVWNDTVIGDTPGVAVLLGWVLGLAAIGFGGALRRAAPQRGTGVPLVERSTTWELLVSVLPFGLLAAVLVASTSKSGDTELMTRSVLAILGALLLLRCTLVAVTAILASRTRHVDRLTSTHNHRRFYERMPYIVNDALESGELVAMLAIDVDDFTVLNDAAGHAEGDRWLRDAAWALRAQLDSSMSLYRTGADQFIILATGCDADAARELAEHCTRALEGIDPAGTIAPTVTTGIAVAPTHAASPEELAHLALGTCYWGQLGGTGTITVYDDQIVTVLDEDERLRHSEHTASLRAVLGLARALDARDAYTARHSENVARYAVAIARELGWPGDQIELLHMAGLVHDVGKIGVRDSTLLKSGKLDTAEWNEMRQHPELGARVIADVTPDVIVPWVLAHHERPDGTGYPLGLHADAIPQGAKILAVADTFDAMTSNRSYRAAMPPLRAVDIIVSEVGAQFDPDAVRGFLSALRKGSIDVAQVAARATTAPAQAQFSAIAAHDDEHVRDPEFHLPAPDDGGSHDSEITPIVRDLVERSSMSDDDTSLADAA